MGNMFYLLNMSVAGIKSIREEIRLDFYKKTVDKNFNPDKYRIKAIYGENGSGKSAIVTAVKIFQDLVMNVNYLSESKTQIFLDEIINKSTRAFRFCCEFLVDANVSKIVYYYSVSIKKNEYGLYEIEAEALKVRNGNYANNKYRTIFACRNGELVSLQCSDDVKSMLKMKSMNLLQSRPFLNIYVVNSTDFAADFSEKPEDRELMRHMLFCSMLMLAIHVYLGEEDQHEWYFLRKQLKQYRQDDGFSGVNERMVDKKYFEKYKEKVEQLTQFIKIFKPELVTIDIERKERGEQYECDLNLNYGSYCINREFESTGIKKLIRLFDCFVAASTTGIVFVDEMDSNLNDVYLCKLIEYFMYYGKGQLCFTTHNLDPMTVLKENKNSIDFLSNDNRLISWTSRGNAAPENCYKNGMIEDVPFNIDATDFVGILGE